MRNIVVVTDTFFPMFDGVMRFITEIIPRLKNDFKITIFAPSYDGSKEEEWQGMKVVKFPVSKRIKVSGYGAPKPRFRKMKKYIKDADAVFVQSGPMLGGAATLVARRLKKPVVMYMHQIPWEQLSHIVKGGKRWKRIVYKFAIRYTKFFAKKCNLILIPSKEVKQKLREVGIKTDMAFVPLGIDVDKFKPSENKEESKRKLGLDPSRLIIGYCGRISKEKGLDTLQKAYRKLIEEHKNLFLLIVGEGEEKIKKSINQLPNTMVTGFMQDVVPYYQAMDMFVLPSLTETTGLSTLEAMACHVPVVVTPVGFALHLKNGFNGLLFPKNSSYVLAKKLKKFIMDEGYREFIGDNERHTVQKKYTWTNTYRKIRRILERI